MSPLYEYECSCGNRFEVLAYDLEDKPCPECGTLAKKLVSRLAHIKLKGYPRFVDRIDDYQKRQVDRGETPTMPHPSEVL